MQSILEQFEQAKRKGNETLGKTAKAKEKGNKGEAQGVAHIMAIGQEAGGYGPSDDEGEAYRQDFIHYHVGEIAEHMEQMAIGPEAREYGHSDDGIQRSDRSNGTAAMCNRAEGQSSDENNASQQHSEYSRADECGRSKRSIEPCRSDSSGRSDRHIESCSSDSSGRSQRNIESCSSDDSMEWSWRSR